MKWCAAVILTLCSKDLAGGQAVGSQFIFQFLACSTSCQNCLFLQKQNGTQLSWAFLLK